MAVHPSIPARIAEILAAESGLQPLPIIDAVSNASMAAQSFRRNGFVIVENAFAGHLLAMLRRRAHEIMALANKQDPEHVGTRGKARYSFASFSYTKNQVHDAEWAQLIDIPSVNVILEEIWGSKEYACFGGAGDFCLPGALDHQHLHSDVGSAQLDAEVAPWISVNFFIDDQTPFNGPMRVIPQTQHSCAKSAPAPVPVDESWKSLMSTICPVKAGSVLIRDMRCWHGGTPNISTIARALPSIHYMAPFLNHEFANLPKVLPYALWQKLSTHGKRISQYIRAKRGVKIQPPMKVFPGRQRVWTQQIAFYEPCQRAFAQTLSKKRKRESKFSND